MSSSPRPRLKIPYSKGEWAFELLSIGSIVSSVIILLVFYPELPQQVPVHFSFDGKINKWSHKTFLFLLPGISFCIYSLLTFLSRFPENFNYLRPISENNALHHYRTARLFINSLKSMIVFFFFIMLFVTVQYIEDTRYLVQFVTMAGLGLVLVNILLSVYFLIRLSKDS